MRYDGFIMKRRPYDSDLSDAQWSVIATTLPPPRLRGKPRAGRSRRMLPHDLPPLPTVHKYAKRWQADGTRF